VVGGQRADRVTGVFKTGAARPAQKDGGAVAPTFTDEHNACRSAYTALMTGEYTLLDVPGAGVTVIWSWTLQGDGSAVINSRSFVNDLFFG
jgi:hypothetical protein